MQESVIYRSIQQERDRAIALNLLREGLSVELVARGTGLSLPSAKRSFPKKFNNFSSR